MDIAASNAVGTIQRQRGRSKYDLESTRAVEGLGGYATSATTGSVILAEVQYRRVSNPSSSNALIDSRPDGGIAKSGLKLVDLAIWGSSQSGDRAMARRAKVSSGYTVKTESAPMYESVAVVHD